MVVSGKQVTVRLAVAAVSGRALALAIPAVPVTTIILASPAVGAVAAVAAVAAGPGSLNLGSRSAGGTGASGVGLIFYKVG